MPEAVLIGPDGALAPGIRVVSSTRQGGVSEGAWASLNLGAHVGDDPAAVRENRRLLHRAAGLPAEPVWLDQVHGARVLDLDAGIPEDREADAAVTTREDVVLAVLTADCLPVVLAAGDGSAVGIAHCGWRGLDAGVLEATVRAMPPPPEALTAWLGPAISATAYEVGEEVAARFEGLAGAVIRHGGRRPHLDLYAVARASLATAGVGRVSGGGRCTYGEPGYLYSHRREPGSGRQATLAWRAPG